MDTLKWLLFENPWPALAVAALAEIVLLLRWRALRTPRAAHWLLAPVAAGAILFVISLSVVTLRERLQTTMKEVSAHAARLDVDGVARYFDPNLTFASSDQTISRTDAIRRARIGIVLYSVQQVTVRRVKINQHDYDAQMDLITTIVSGRSTTEVYNMQWHLDWRYDKAHGWRIVVVSQPEFVGLTG